VHTIAKNEKKAALLRIIAEEKRWKLVHDRIGWTYLHEPPFRYQSEFEDSRNQHHMLAWLQAANWDDICDQVSISTLNEIHGVRCRNMGQNYSFAKQCLDRETRRDPRLWAYYVRNIESYAFLEKPELIHAL